MPAAGFHALRRRRPSRAVRRDRGVNLGTGLSVRPFPSRREQWMVSATLGAKPVLRLIGFLWQAYGSYLLVRLVSASLQFSTRSNENLLVVATGDWGCHRCQICPTPKIDAGHEGALVRREEDRRLRSLRGDAANKRDFPVQSAHSAISSVAKRI